MKENEPAKQAIKTIQCIFDTAVARERAKSRRKEDTDEQA